MPYLQEALWNCKGNYFITKFIKFFGLKTGRCNDWQSNSTALLTTGDHFIQIGINKHE